MKSRAYYNEIDPYCVQWLKNLIAAGHIADGDVDSRSILELKPEDLDGFDQVHLFAGIGIWSHALRQAYFGTNIPIWTISCPCQPFSHAGDGEGLNDERHLWPKAFDLIKNKRPLCIVGEQVASPDALEWLDVVHADLEGANYSVGVVDTCAAGFGAPHIRQRLYWFAYAGRISDECERECRETLSALESARSQTQQRKRRGTDARNSVSVDGSSDARSGGCDAWISGDERRQESEGSPHGSKSDRCGISVRSDDAQCEGLEGFSGNEFDRNESRWINSEPIRPAPTAGVLNGFWGDAIWLPCTDFTKEGKRKYRPTKRGLQPMAARNPNHVGRLRAYGNALCAPQAIAFLQSVKEIVDPEEEITL